MKKINQEAEQILEKLLSFILPPSWSGKERMQIAEKAGISYETLRTLGKRKNFKADTLIKLLLARGVSPENIANLPQTELQKLSSGEALWIEFGRSLDEAEKREFVSLLQFIKERWRLEKP